MGKLKLNLGCGNDHMEGYVNVDKYSAADMKVDLEILPWPWETNSVEKVVLKHVLEHLGQSTDLYLGIIKELYRVCAPNAEVVIEVPHPMHPDYLGDPTHCRPVTMEGLHLFNLDYANWLIENKCIGTPLAKYMEVDFVIMENLVFWDQARNIHHASKITLKVRKDIKVAVMASGIGDVCFGLGTAHSLANAGFRVTLVAQERFHELVKACPHVYAVTETDRENEIWTCIWHQLQPIHQIDVCNQVCGLNDAPNSAKSVDIQVPAEITDMMEKNYPGNNRVALHPGGSIESRIWPVENWQELADRLNAEGVEVIVTGMTIWPWCDDNSTKRLSGTKEAFDYSLFQSIALYNQCKVLVSPDAGPIQLAGATDCGIVGLYSVIAPEFRLPYRHGELGWNAFGIKTPCPYSSCYNKIVSDRPFFWSERAAPIAETDGLDNMVQGWCLNEEAPMSCMRAISVDEVFEKTMKLYRKNLGPVN